MKITYKEEKKEDLKLRQLNNGDVFGILGDKHSGLYIVGEYGIGVTNKREVTSLKDGAVTVIPDSTLVIEVQGEFICTC